MKKFMAIFVAFLVAVGAVICTERVVMLVLFIPRRESSSKLFLRAGIL